MKPYTPSKQLQVNEQRAEKAQPAVHTPKSTGNFNQYSKFMLNNGRSR